MNTTFTLLALLVLAFFLLYRKPERYISPKKNTWMLDDRLFPTRY